MFSSPLKLSGPCLAAIVSTLDVGMLASVAEEARLTTRGDKRQYHLFNPTPADQMRELSADRPDKTESAFTVDPGHFQLEMDFANLTYDRSTDDDQEVRTTSYEIAPLNLKLGVLNNVDVQLVLSPYGREVTENNRANSIERHSGFGDVTPRVKMNIVGNDGGPFALAIMPFAKLPSSQSGLGNSAVEGGLKLPYWFAARGWDVSAMTEVDFNRDESGNGYHPEFINSISVGHVLVGRLSGYVEFFANVSAEHNSDWVGTLDTWLTYRINENVRLDAGVYLGTTSSAEDWHPFIGLTWRY